jgi:signal peptidase I
VTTTDDPERTGTFEPGTDRSITLPQAPDRRARIRSALSWAITIAIALGITFVIKTWVLQVYSIPSTSMVPTLEIGDRVVVSKLEKDPGRGDVVVFERPPTAPAAPGDPDVLIKRVIGLPGERVSSREGRVYVDGKLLQEDYLPDGVITTIGCRSVWGDCAGNELEEGYELVVPPDSYLVMGDNRPHSSDGREFGPIHRDLIVGRGILRIWPFRRFGGL